MGLPTKKELAATDHRGVGLVRILSFPFKFVTNVGSMISSLCNKKKILLLKRHSQMAYQISSLI